jgi:hypothetical protein
VPVNHRTTSKRNCPGCRGLIVTVKNCLLTHYPELSKEWHPTKNDTLTPRTVTKCSGKRVWWQCSKCDYEWQATISNRSMGNCGCKKCVKSNNVSKMEIEWLETFNNSNIIFGHRINRQDKKGCYYKVDGFDPVTNTIYEFNGGLFHGDPRVYNPENISPINHKSFGELYKKTMERENDLRKMGYNIVVMWEKDWLELQKKK